MQALKLLIVPVLFTVAATPLLADTSAIETYLREAQATGFFSKGERDARRGKSDRELRIVYDNMLPLSNTKPFLDYLDAKARAEQRFPNATQLGADAIAAQFNKLLGSSVGTSGTTSLTSGSAVSSILSLAMEYGAITQTNSGNVATVRTNLFALARPFVGGEVFPTCTDSDRIMPCNTASRWLRKLSASYSAETSGAGTTVITGTDAQTGSGNTTNIFGGGFRTAGWSARMDWFAANPYRVAQDRFTDALKTVAASNETKSLESSIEAIFRKPAYEQWAIATIKDLEYTDDDDEGKRRLEADLDMLIRQMRKSDTDFDSNVAKAQNAYQGYYNLLDKTIRDLQTNKFSTEFASQHPLGQANTSNIRVIYSWQPTKTPLLLTFNGAVTWYDSIPSDVTAVKVGKLRDAQFSAQLDRKVRNLGSIQNSVFTIAGYYQWQFENALITIGSGNMAPGTGITLPGTAATLLAPKGNIAIAQLKWTLPIKNGVVKIPFSFTWANRTELLDESEKRGEVGLTLDLDSAFAKRSR